MELANLRGNFPKKTSLHFFPKLFLMRGNNAVNLRSKHIISGKNIHHKTPRQKSNKITYINHLSREFFFRRQKTISKHQKKTKSKDEMLLFVGRKKKNRIKTSNYLRWSEVCFETKENGFPVFPQTVREARPNPTSEWRRKYNSFSLN